MRLRHWLGGALLAPLMVVATSLGPRPCAWPRRCATGPGPITSYDGTPTAFGIGLRDHLRSLP